MVKIDIKVYNDGLISSPDSGTEPIGIQLRAEAINTTGTAQGIFDIRIVGKDYTKYKLREKNEDITTEKLLKEFAEEKIKTLLQIDAVKIDAYELEKYNREIKALTNQLETKDKVIEELTKKLDVQNEMIIELTLMISNIGLTEEVVDENETENQSTIDDDNNLDGGEGGE